jgi:hypothetical protein
MPFDMNPRDDEPVDQQDYERAMCIHEWYLVPAHLLRSGLDDVQCARCGIVGERNNQTHDVSWRAGGSSNER